MMVCNVRTAKIGRNRSRDVASQLSRSWYRNGRVVTNAEQLLALDAAKAPDDIRVPGWKFHRLHGGLAGHSGVSVSGNWRLTFAFDGEGAILVDYQDYH